MSETNGNDGGGEFVPINRAAMTKGDSAVQGQPDADQVQPVQVGELSRVGTDSARPQESVAHIQQAKFAANLPEWDLLPPVIPIKRVKRQL